MKKSQSKILNAIFAVTAMVAMVAYCGMFTRLAQIFANEQEDMSHGYLVPLFSAYVVWADRKELGRLVAKGAPSWGGVAALGVSMVLLLFGCGKANDTNAPDETAAPDASASDTATDAGQLDFTTVDFDGNAFTTADLANAKVVLLNFWEPWCGPCVGEIPDLARLYEEYKDQGLLIVGAYSENSMDDDIRSLIAENNITYPLVRAGGNMSEFMTSYVPTTVFADGTGKIISSEPEIGAHSYGEWKALIEDYLAKS